jgi:hypothetical protein
MSNHTLLHRLRRHGQSVEDPDAAVVMRRLVEVAELDERLRRLDPGTPEHERVEEELARKSHEVIDDSGTTE